MKKVIATILLVISIAVLFTGCGKCKYSGCSEKVYKDGYCEMHYALKAVSDMFS